MRTPELTDTAVIHALFDDPENAFSRVRRDATLETLRDLRVELEANGATDQADALWMRAQYLYRRRKENDHGPR